MGISTVNAVSINGEGEEEDILGILDIERKDPEFMEWSEHNVGLCQDL
jgi:hypothetical protein